MCVCVFVEGCTFVLINGDVMSSGIWEMDGCTVGNEPNGALFFLLEELGASTHEGVPKLFNIHPLEKKQKQKNTKKKHSMHVRIT